MSTISSNGSISSETAFEIDMRDLVRAKRAELEDVSKDTGNDYSSLVTRISAQSVQEIDCLIDGLRMLREKLNNDRDRLHSQIGQHDAFSQSIIQLSEIVSEGLASVGKAAPPPKDVA